MNIYIEIGVLVFGFIYVIMPIIYFTIYIDKGVRMSFIEMINNTTNLNKLGIITKRFLNIGCYSYMLIGYCFYYLAVILETIFNFMFYKK